MSPWPRRRGWIGLWLWLLLGSWLGGGVGPSFAQQPVIAYEPSYAETTHDVISVLNFVAQGLRSNDPWMAEANLRTIVPLLDKLGAMTDRISELADREHGHCIDQITALEVKIGELYQQEQELAHQVQELEAQVANATQSRNLAQAEVDQLRAQMETTAAGLREREQKLRELMDWWWVPGYGQYLGIRTLVDQDAEAYNNLAGRLQDSAGLAQASQAAVQAAAIAIEELTTAQQQASGTIERLHVMREREQTRLGELKETVVFLVNAERFWGRIRNLLDLDINSQVAVHLEYLQSELAGDVSVPDFEDPAREYVLDLEEGLLQFAATVDSGSNFLLEDGSEYCGGGSA